MDWLERRLKKKEIEQVLKVAWPHTNFDVSVNTKGEVNVLWMGEPDLSEMDRFLDAIEEKYNGKD